jgi:hypothetical protein
VSGETQRFTVGAAAITSVVEDEVPHIPPEVFFPEGSASAVAQHGWLVPEYADIDGNVTLRVQAFVLALAARTILIYPCVGNDKVHALPFWDQQSYPFLERFAQAELDFCRDQPMAGDVPTERGPRARTPGGSRCRRARPPLRRVGTCGRPRPGEHRSRHRRDAERPCRAPGR